MPSDEPCPVCGNADCETHSEDEQDEARRRAAAGQEPLVLAHDPAQQNKRRKKEDQLAEQMRADLHWVMRHERGRRVIYRQLERCGYATVSAVLANFDPHKTMFFDGMRNVGVQLFAELRALPDEYAQMMRENGGK